MQTWSSNGIFATSMVATYLADKKELTLCNAGHPRPLFYRARTDTWELLDAVRSVSSKPADLPLGVLSGTTYPQTTLNLEPGDHLVLYTDLMIEAHDASGIPRGEPGLLELTRRLSPHGELLGSRLVEEVLSHAGPNSPADDITVLELRQTGQGPRPPGLAEKLQVYGKFFGLLPV
jgi:sigma-B regulation protein RsbU (phosphoserine phosphatase)